MQNNTTALNETEDEECYIHNGFRYFGLFCGLVLTILCLSGMLGNLLSMYVFSRSHYRTTPVNLLLTALSGADCLLLLLAIPVYVLVPYWTFLCEGEIKFFIVTYTISLAYIFPITNMCQCASVWLLVCVTIEQWFAICWPRVLERCFDRTRAITTALMIIVLAILYNVSGFWELYIDETFMLKEGLRAVPPYALWKNTVADYSLTFIMPLLVLVVFNSMVYRQIVLARKARFTMSSEDKATHRTARMLLYVVLMFIFCYTLSFILIVWEVMNRDWFISSAGAAVSDINNILAAMNSATSFLFYLRFSSRYRRTAAALFRRTCGKNSQPIPKFSVMTSSAGSFEGPDIMSMLSQFNEHLKGSKVEVRGRSVSLKQKNSSRKSTRQRRTCSMSKLKWKPRNRAKKVCFTESNCSVDQDSTPSNCLVRVAQTKRLELNLLHNKVENKVCSTPNLERVGNDVQVRALKCVRSLSSSALNGLRLMAPDGTAFRVNSWTDLQVEPDIISFV